ncbi:MAG: DUF3857 and transglutaminase domain-containing protein [bacterium]|nr:DUF3857 and transglutaminase domain-containing protein [bacterium]
MLKFRVLILLAAVMLSFVFFTGCEKPVPVPVNVEYRDKPAENQTLLKFKNGQFTFEKDGKKVKVDKNDISEITFGEKQGQDGVTTTGPGTADEKEFEQYKKYFDLAKELQVKYPDVEGIQLHDEATWVLNPDGTRKYHVKFIGIILKPTAKEWGTMGHYLDKSRFKIDVIKGRTITPDGKIYDMDPNSINISKPSSGTEFYSRGEVFTFTLPNLEVGNLVEYEYVVDYFNPFNKDIFQGNWYFSSMSPIYYSKLTIIIPSDKKLQFVTRNLDDKTAKPKKTEKDETVEYVWESHELPYIVKEIMMPDLGDVLPRLAFTTTPSWDYLMEWSNSLIKDKIEVTPEIEKKVNEIVMEANAQTTEEKLAAIYHWVQKNIKYISIKGDISTGWTGHPALETLTNGYGDCIDKSILFCTMLKVVGIEADPISVLTRGSGTAVRDIPFMEANHAITEVFLKDKTLILDSTTPPFRYPFFPTSDKGITYVNEIKKKIGFIPDNPPVDNGWFKDTTGELLEDGNLNLVEEWKYTGDYEFSLKLTFQSYVGEIRTQVFQNFLNSMSPGAVLKDLYVKNEEEIAKPLETKITYTLPNYPVYAQDLVIFRIPVSYYFDEISLDKRKFDLVYFSVEERTNKFTINFPKSYKVEYLPKSVHYKSEFVEYSGSYKIQGNTLVFEDSYKVLKTVVPKEKYLAHKDLLQKISKFTQEQVFFSKK